MQFTAGASLTHYLITGPIGQGGMGEVYRAEDKNLRRAVAIKVLPPELAGDAERLARFRREAQLLAALNHSRIAAIHGLEQDGATPFLVMELVEGENLASRLRGGRLSLDEVVDLSRQLAEALEAAHEKGIVHRDLKPANIMLTGEGGVKVLDFGLAKAFTSEGTDAPSDLTNSPTIARSVTGTGVILGTAAYMSPEQARGKAVDKRTDIWSYGVVLFEMLTGRRLFHGEAVSDALAAVLRQEIDWTALPSTTPPNIARLLKRCLVRSVPERLRDIGEARIALSEPEQPARSIAPPAARSRMRPTLNAAIAVLAVGAACFATWLLKPEPPRRVVRASIETPPGVFIVCPPNSRPNIAVSPDGSAIAFVAASDVEDPSTEQVYLRRLDAAQTTVVPGSRRGRAPFFSSDGTWVAFVAEDTLKKVPLTGGAPTVLAPEVANGWGGTWLENGTIIYANFLATGEALFAVDANGGPARVARRMQKLNEDYSFPMAMGGNDLLITRWLGGSYADARIERIDLESNAETVLLEGGSNPHLLDSGHLVYARGSELFAVPFNQRKRLLAGTPVPVLSGVLAESRYGVPFYAVSPGGTLVYAPAVDMPEMSISWIDSAGRTELIASAPYLEMPRLSQDGRTIAYVGGEGDKDIWRIDLTTGRRLRLTTARGEDYAPALTPDGRAIAFAAWRETNELRQVSMSGDREEQILAGAIGVDSLSLSSDGRWLSVDGNPAKSKGIGVVDLRSATRAPRWILDTQVNESQPAFAPRGERLAYVSDQSGRPEVWVRAAVETVESLVVSRDGGSAPFWSPDGRTLYFTAGAKLFAASVTTTGPLAVSTPQLVMHARGATIVGVAGDGRFLAHRREIPKVSRLEIILNWREELKAKLDATR